MHASSAVYLQSVVITMTIRVLKWFSMPGSISEVADVQGVKKLVKHGHKSSCFLDLRTQLEGCVCAGREGGSHSLTPRC